MTTHHLSVVIAMWFLFGFLSSVRVNIGYVYLMEMLPAKWQPHITSIWNIQEGGIYVIATIYFWKISTQGFYFLGIGLIFNILSVIILFFLPESPRYLVSTQKLNLAKAGFEIIAKFNRKSLVWNEKLYMSRPNTDD